MSAAASSFSRRRCLYGVAARYYLRHLSWSTTSSISRQHASSFAAQELLQPKSTKYHPDHLKSSSRILSLPWLMLSSPAKPQSRYLYRLSLDDHRFKLDKVLDLPEIAGNHCIGISQGYVFTVPACCSPDIVAINPLTKSRLPLPPTAALPECPISDSDLKLYWESEQLTGVDSKHFNLVHSGAILAPSLDTVVLFRYPNEKALCGQAFYCRLPSASSSSWMPLSLPMLIGSMDCSFHRGQFFSVEDTGAVILIKEIGLQPPLFIPRFIQFEEPADSIHLLESPDGEELFLVQRRYPPRYDNLRIPGFEVFRLDKNGKYRWKQVDSLGGLTFFVGANQSVSVLAADFPGLVPDSIYFTDDDLTFGTCPEVGKTGVFRLQDETFNLIPFADDEEVDVYLLNWPPPMWYMPVAAARSS